MAVRGKVIESRNMMELSQRAQAINIKPLMQEPLFYMENMSPLQNLEISYCHFIVGGGMLAYILNMATDLNQ